MPGIPGSPSLHEVSKPFRSPCGYLLLRSEGERSELEVDRLGSRSNGTSMSPLSSRGNNRPELVAPAEIFVRLARSSHGLSFRVVNVKCSSPTSSSKLDMIGFQT